MTSLATCIRRAGKALAREDADGIREIMADGMTADEAIDEYLEVMADERAQLVAEIEAHGGRPSKLSEFAPRLRMEDIELDSDEKLAAMDPRYPAIQRRFAEYVTGRDWVDIVDEYKALNDDTSPENTENGRINSVDSWRELSEDYRNDRSVSAAIHEVGSALSKKYYYEFLAEPPQGGPGSEYILFTSGGTGVAKTSGLGMSKYNEGAAMVFDGNLAKQPSAEKKIDAALKSGRLVVVNHTIREPIEALVNGAVTRAMRQERIFGTGRPVPLSGHVGTNVGASDTIRGLTVSYRGDARLRYEYNDNTNGKGNMDLGTIDSVLNLNYNEKLAEAEVALKDMYENGHPDTAGYPLSTKLYYAFLEQPIPEGAGRFHANFEGYVDPDAGTTEDVQREGGRGPAGTDSRGERESTGAVPRVDSGVQQAQLQLALAPAIRALAGTVQVHIVQSASELPGDVTKNAGAEGMFRPKTGDKEFWLVADNLPTAERAKKVFAHEAFGHLAMEKTPEFNDVLASVKNLLAMGNKTFKDVAEQVAARQGNLSETNQAKEILAYMVENDVQNGTVARAMAAVRAKLRDWGLLDGVNYSEAEIKGLLVRAARDLVSGAEAKQRALAAMPVQEQILSDPNAVESAIQVALREVHASRTLQDSLMDINASMEATADPEAQAQLQQLRYRAQIAPSASPDVLDPEALYQRAFHGTAASPFPQFDLNYIGTGEGAQVYGWGLYFTSKRGIAKWYSNKLGGGYTFSYGGQSGLDREDATEAMAQDLFDTLFEGGMASRDADRASYEVAGAAMHMWNRHMQGPLSPRNALGMIRDELANQAINYQKKADVAVRQHADRDDLGPARERVIARDKATAEAFRQMTSQIALLTGEKAGGNIIEAEVPEDDEMLHYEDTIAEHSESVQASIKSRYPELWEEQWTDTATGDPLTDEYVESIPDDPEAMGFVREAPYHSMTGNRLYEYIGTKEVENQRLKGTFGKIFQGYGRAVMLGAHDRLASETLRDKLNIPGHSYIGATSQGVDYVIYDDSAISIEAINDQPVSELFSRPGQHLQIEDTQRGQPPQDAAQAAFPAGLDTRSYWALASEAGTRAFNEPPGSWEERYYTEMGRQASQAAKQPPVASMPTEQIDMLFSRTLRSETKKNPAKPGEPFLVYRLASANRSDLANTNGGNAEAVALHLLRSQESEGPAPQFGFGDTVHVYEVVADKFGKYSGIISGSASSEQQAGVVGRTTGMGIAYSFGESGYKAKLLKSMSVDKLNQKLKKQTGWSDFDWAGTKLGSKFLRSKFEGKDYSKAFAKSRRKAAEPMPWETGGDLYSRRSRRRAGQPRIGRGGAPTQEELAQFPSLISNERLLTDNPASGERRPLTPEERRKMNAPLMSRYIHPDPEIEAIRARNLAPALEDIGIKDRIREVVQRITGIDWHSVKQGMIDSADAVRRLEEGLFGELLDASESAYKSILATRNIGSVMAAIMHRGIPIYNNGVFSPRTGRQGLLEIFEPITQHADGNLLPLWELYAAALRSSRLIKERNPDGTIKEKQFTQAEIDKALTLGDQYPIFREVHNNWQKFNSQLLDLAIKRGVINAEEAKMWRRNDYVPFYRAMETMEYGEEGQGPRSGRGGVANVRSGIKRLSGEKAPIGNVFENMVMNTAYLTDAIFRNTAMQRVVAMADMIAMEKIPMAWDAQKFSAGDIARALMNAGLIVGTGSTEADMFNDGIRQVKAMTTEQREQWVTLFRRVAPQGNDVVHVLENGKPVYYRVLDPLLLRSIGAMGAQSWGGIMNVFRLAKRTLTGAVVIDPAFMLANFVRDTLSTSVITKGSATKQITGAIKGLKAAWNEDPDMLALMMAGAGGGGYYDHNPAEVRKMLGRKMPSGEVNHFVNSVLTPKGLWRFWQRVGSASEQGNRISMFRNTLESGGSVAEAAYQARDVLNFTMSGDYGAMKFIVQSVPFLNARIQGLYRLYRGGKENPIGVAMKGLGLTAATMALLLRNLDDDRYKELPEWDKDTYWHFFIGDEHFRLPKPFEVGAIFATVPERMYMLASGEDDFGMTFERLTRMAADTFAFNPIPQAIKPLQEQYSNRNMFTGNPIVGFALEGLEPEAQYDPWTSETMREMAKVLPGWLGSPKRLEAFVRGYFGTVGMYALGASDSVTRRAFGHPERPTKAIQDYPVVTRFWRNPEARTTKYASQMYDMLNEADDLYRTMNAYRKQGRIEEVREIMTEDKGKLAARAFLHDIASKVRDINHVVRRIQYSDLPADVKKERIDKLNRKRLDLMAKVARVSDVF